MSPESNAAVVNNLVPDETFGSKNFKMTVESYARASHAVRFWVAAAMMASLPTVFGDSTAQLRCDDRTANAMGCDHWHANQDVGDAPVFTVERFGSWDDSLVFDAGQQRP